MVAATGKNNCHSPSATARAKSMLRAEFFGQTFEARKFAANTFKMHAKLKARLFPGLPQTRAIDNGKKALPRCFEYHLVEYIATLLYFLLICYGVDQPRKNINK